MTEHDDGTGDSEPHAALKCQSCGFPIETGPYCEHCTDENGELQGFDERYARMVQFTMNQDPCIGRVEAERRTREYMAKMPAWKDHPELIRKS